MKVLAIDPCAGTTRVGIFTRHEVVRTAELAPVGPLPAADEPLEAQAAARLPPLQEFLAGGPSGPDEIAAAVSRGGLLRPLRAGTYLVNDLMIRDLQRPHAAAHPASLGALLAHGVAGPLRLPSLVVDPLSTDEIDETARFSGLNGVDRTGPHDVFALHTAARYHARTIGRRADDLRLVVAHLGHAVVVAALANGRIVDATDPAGEGAFWMDRAGGLPTGRVLELALSGAFTRGSLRRRLEREGGVRSYLGPVDLGGLIQRVEADDDHAVSVFRALVRSVARQVGAFATVLQGRVDAVLVAGPGAAHAALTDALRAQVAFIAPFVIMPEVDDLRTLADSAFRVLDREEELQAYE